MNKPMAVLLAGCIALAGCGNADDRTAEAETAQAKLEAGTGEADMSPTLEGSGDLSSAAGAGAATNAMDGGTAGDDGTPPVAQGEGGTADTLDQKAPPAR
jgi:outer membrane protein TolC